MTKGFWAAVVGTFATGACTFSSGEVAPADSKVADARPADAPVEIDAAPACTTPKHWSATFDTSPLGVDDNADGVADFAIRAAAPATPLPGTLADGVWTEPAQAGALDTQPKYDFPGTTTVHVIMRASKNTPGSATYPGAVAWINAAYGGGDYAPLWIGVNRTGAAQTVTLFTRTSQSDRVALLSSTGFDGELLDMTLVVKAREHEAALTVNGTTKMATFAEIPVGPNDDRWVTLLAWEAEAEFAELTVDACP